MKPKGGAVLARYDQKICMIWRLFLLSDRRKFYQNEANKTAVFGRVQQTMEDNSTDATPLMAFLKLILDFSA